jgi:hypothetical protein
MTAPAFRGGRAAFMGRGKVARVDDQHCIV